VTMNSFSKKTKKLITLRQDFKCLCYGMDFCGGDYDTDHMTFRRISYSGGRTQDNGYMIHRNCYSEAISGNWEVPELILQYTGQKKRKKSLKALQIYIRLKKTKMDGFDPRKRHHGLWWDKLYELADLDLHLFHRLNEEIKYRFQYTPLKNITTYISRSHFTSVMKKHMTERDGGCVLKDTVTEYEHHGITHHHIVAVADGGLSDTPNGITLCHKCRDNVNLPDDSVVASLNKVIAILKSGWEDYDRLMPMTKKEKGAKIKRILIKHIGWLDRIFSHEHKMWEDKFAELFYLDKTAYKELQVLYNKKSDVNHIIDLLP